MCICVHVRVLIMAMYFRKYLQTYLHMLHTTLYSKLLLKTMLLCTFGNIFIRTEIDKLFYTTYLRSYFRTFVQYFRTY